MARVAVAALDRKGDREPAIELVQVRLEHTRASVAVTAATALAGSRGSAVRAQLDSGFANVDVQDLRTLCWRPLSTMAELGAHCTWTPSAGTGQKPGADLVEVVG